MDMDIRLLSRHEKNQITSTVQKIHSRLEVVGGSIMVDPNEAILFVTIANAWHLLSYGGIDSLKAQIHASFQYVDAVNIV